MADTDRPAGAGPALLAELRELVQQTAGRVTDDLGPSWLRPALAPAGPGPNTAVEGGLQERFSPTTTGERVGYAGVASDGESRADSPGRGPTYTLQVAQSEPTHTSGTDASSAHLSLASSGTQESDKDAATTRIVALVELAQAGDAEAFGQLYDAYVSTIYRYIYYRVGTHALAEDLTSDTFLRALRSLSSFRWQGRDFGAWLITIARNLITDHFKSGRFRLEVATGEILDYDWTSDGPEDDVLANLTNQVLIDAVKQLRADQQECLVLRFLNGLSVAETATVLDKSDGAIKQLQLRAIRNLAKLIPDGLR